MGGPGFIAHKGLERMTDRPWPDRSFINWTSGKHGGLWLIFKRYALIPARTLKPMWEVLGPPVGFAARQME